MVQLMVALLWLAGHASAAEVAFIESYDLNGKRIQLEPNGQFMHVAIRVGDYWLHAHPASGVELIPTLERYGHRIIRLINEDVPEPSPELFFHWLGKGFDHAFTWEDPERTYCSRLVANMLGIAPLPMQFAAERWQVVQQKRIGSLGLSPDDLYSILLDKGYTEDKADCASFMATDGGKVNDKATRLYQ